MNSRHLTDLERRRLIRWLTDRAGHMDRCRARMVELGWPATDPVLLEVAAAVASLREAISELERQRITSTLRLPPPVPDCDMTMGRQVGADGDRPAVYPRDLRNRGDRNWPLKRKKEGH